MLVIVLVLTRLVLGDVAHISAAQATVHDSAASTMMGGQPCAGMGSTSTEQAGRPLPGNDGMCCKSSQCPCLHAPALLMSVQTPTMFHISYTELAPTEVHRISGPPAVFFRPPIQTLH